ncbi:hypothetical protein EJ06DRAFT_578685 [Trichodelitschia bisporula]|uniref:MARVEL domain-containing protein n=1 Tax=Trichodelitschia bisporula TaxID=703511 RepID=A0A6G1IBW6_9PEZI|nr:hypothetical protein EJ06DRAFT_578685 [Trichodelitschia bisporula]
MPTEDKINPPTRPRNSSLDSLTLSIKTPRTARFAEATTVYSPIEPSTQQSAPATAKRDPFADPPTNHYLPQPQPADVGFGYLKNQHLSVEMEETDRNYLPPPTPRSPLKSALKSPGAPPKNPSTIFSPTFREEQMLEKHEVLTEKEQARDLKAKTRVRMAKLILRSVNFSCSLIVLSMLGATFTIFNATRALPPRNGLPPWANNTKTWPQIVLLVIACLSLFMSLIIFYGYWKGGHRRAEKVAVYYTTFAVAFFIFSIVMWGVGAALLNQSKAHGNGQDMWGWACKDNKRRALFQEDVSYALICRLQNWSLVCCIIEVVVEVLTIAIYGIVFFRFYSKRRLRKSMAMRDRARSDMYLAQLRSQSVPNTPGWNGLPSAREGGWRAPAGHPMFSNRAPMDPLSEAEQGQGQGQFAVPATEPKPFALQPPPPKAPAATPKTAHAARFGGLDTPPRGDMSAPTSPVQGEFVREHVPAAPGEAQYAAVSIPGAYAGPPAPVSPVGQGFEFGFQGRR